MVALEDMFMVTIISFSLSSDLYDRIGRNVYYHDYAYQYF